MRWCCRCCRLLARHWGNSERSLAWFENDSRFSAERHLNQELALEGVQHAHAALERTHELAHVAVA